MNTEYRIVIDGLGDIDALTESFQKFIRELKDNEEGVKAYIEEKEWDTDTFYDDGYISVYLIEQE